jgi:hypothetical protein
MSVSLANPNLLPLRSAWKDIALVIVTTLIDNDMHHGFDNRRADIHNRLVCTMDCQYGTISSCIVPADSRSSTELVADQEHCDWVEPSAMEYS